MLGEGILSTLAVLKFLGDKLVYRKSSHDDKLNQGSELKVETNNENKLNQVKQKLNQGLGPN